MHNNYLNDKENTYRLGVLEGNYVEEINARDFTRSRHKEPRVMLSETKEKYGAVYNDGAQNLGGSTRKLDTTTGTHATTIDSVAKRVVTEDAQGECAVTGEKEVEVDEHGNEVVVSKGVCEPDPNYSQSYKRLIDGSNDAADFGFASKRVNSDKKLKTSELPAHLFLNHGLQTEKPENEDFLTTYNICYDLKIKPQECVDNHNKSTLLKTKVNDACATTEVNSTINSQGNDVKAFAKKDQDFTKAFDKPHMSIGFRN